MRAWGSSAWSEASGTAPRMPPGEEARLSRVIEKVTHGSLGGGWKRKRRPWSPGWDDLAGNRGNADPGAYRRPRHRASLLPGRPTLIKHAVGAGQGCYR